MQVPKSYCPLPFKEIYSDNNGKYKLCCHAMGSRVPVEKPFEFFQSDYMESVREHLLSGNRIYECIPCYRMEKKGGESHRHKAIKYWGTPTTDEKVSLKLRIGTNFCNLSCYMCNAKNSSTRTKELYDIYGDTFLFGEPDRVIKYDQWNKVIDDIVNNIERVERIHLTGGEPLQLPKQWQLLDMIPDSAAKNISISFATNLTQLTWKDKNLDFIRNKFKDVFLGISCDHYGDKLEFIRWPIDVKKFESNLEYIKREGYAHSINVTVSILNIDDLQDIQKHYGNVSFHAVVNTPRMLSISNLPKSLKKDYLWKYRNYDEIIKSELMKDSNELDKCWSYLDDLSVYRKINWRPLWEEFYEKITSIRV